MYYVENTHPAIVSQEVFDMAQTEMRRREAEKDSAAGGSHYACTYPFSGLLICGYCGHKLRRHVRSSGGKIVAAWACTNRLQNGRKVCDSHHLNEDILARMCCEAVAGVQKEAIQTVVDSANQVLGMDNTSKIKESEDLIVHIQEEVLALHKGHQNGLIPDNEYEAKVTSFNHRMADLQAQLKQLKADTARRAEALRKLNGFQQHIGSGDTYNSDEAAIMREKLGQHRTNSTVRTAFTE